MEEQCSDIFAEAFSSHCGGYMRECACGRVYYNTNGGWDVTEEELDEVEERCTKEPEKYFDLDCTVTTMEIGGESIVYGCCCNKARRYERFLINHAEQIVDYLRKRAALLREKAGEAVTSPLLSSQFYNKA